MLFSRKIALALSSALVCAWATAAQADVANSWQVRLRGIGVVPDADATVKSSGTPIGGTTTATNSFVPEVDFTYFLDNNFALELIAATTQHRVTNSVAGTLGTVWLLPPTLTLQYHFSPEGEIRPYVGAGINYTFFYSPTPPPALAPIHYQDHIGFALQAGVDIPFGEDGYFFNLDVKKIFLPTKIRATPTSVITADANLDPWIIGAGVGLRF